MPFKNAVYDNQELTITLRMQMPWEIAETASRKPPEELSRYPRVAPRATAEILRRAYGEPCGYCDRPMLGFRFATRDHKHPRHLGGNGDPENIVLVCSPCNNEKGGLTLYEFLMRLSVTRDFREPLVRRHYKPSEKDSLTPTEWPWLNKLIGPRVRDVGFGPW